MAALPPPAPEVKEFTCSYCSKSFGRAEHRRRHELIHNQNRPFQCSSCPKDFVRRDALQRHELTHQATTPSLLQRGGRACAQCATAKAKCSGDSPCLRCRDRAVQCTFPAFGVGDGQTNSAMSMSGPGPPQTLTAGQLNTNGSQMTDTEILDFEFWDQNVLSATNWLMDDLTGFSLPQVPLNDTFFNPAIASVGNNATFATDLARSPSAGRNQSQAHTQSPASIFSPRSVAVTESNTSRASYDGSAAEPGEYYVDGEPARLPRVKRRKLSSVPKSTPNTISFTGFSLQMGPIPAIAVERTFELQPATYNNIMDLYQRLCINPSPGWAAYEAVDLPQLDVLNVLLDLYQKHFAQILPFLQPHIFAEAQHKEGLVLGMAAIGTHYLEDPSPRLIRSMHEFVRRLLLYQQETVLEGMVEINWARATLLNIVGTAYCGDATLSRFGLDSHHRLRDILTEAQRQAQELQGQSMSSQRTEWLPWVRYEGVIRLAYCAWLVDCMLCIHFRSKSVLGLKDIQLTLPCEDKLWFAGDGNWQELHKVDHLPTLNEALQELYIEKRLPKDRGEFARILIIHGLFHRMWEVEWYLSDPLSHWEPTANRQSSSEVLPKEPIWLPSIPAFNKWQNSACDSLDVLHWQANATIGQASGLEHPTVLHLHFARIVLLTPHAEITKLARAMSKTTSVSHDESIAACKHLIQRWAIQHQYKARLAVIHAGVVFWHVRRYSIDGFYEAPAVALASLVLWAFGTFTNKKASRGTSRQPQSEQQQQRETREESEQSDDAMCSIILLDRPADDEIVQQFIRNGHSMKAHISGVGDLYAARGPERALKQGCKLLASLRCWRVSSTWNELLQGLVEALNKGHSEH